MKKENASIISILANLFLATAKIILGLLSKSSAVLAEGIHSGMDIVTSIISYLGIKAAKKPVDKEHPYGHYKIEVFSGMIITIILLATSGWIIYEAITGFFTAKELFVTPLLLGVMIGSAIVNEIMARIKINTGKKYESMALIADGQHSRLDVFASISVFLGLLFARYWIHIDSIVALLVGSYILIESLSLGKKTTDSLLDVNAGEETEKKILEIVNKENIELESLKTQKLGAAVFAELKIKLDPKIKVEEASKITKKLENKIQKEIPAVQFVVIQIESHKIKESTYQGIGGRIAWRGRMGGKSLGPSGICKCPECGYEIPHKRGVPCFKEKCPKCNVELTRKR